MARGPRTDSLVCQRRALNHLRPGHPLNSPLSARGKLNPPACLALSPGRVLIAAPLGLGPGAVGPRSHACASVTVWVQQTDVPKPQARCPKGGAPGRRERSPGPVLTPVLAAPVSHLSRSSLPSRPSVSCAGRWTPPVSSRCQSRARHTSRWVGGSCTLDKPQTLLACRAATRSRLVCMLQQSNACHGGRLVIAFSNIQETKGHMTVVLRDWGCDSACVDEESPLLLLSGHMHHSQSG